MTSEERNTQILNLLQKIKDSHENCPLNVWTDLKENLAAEIEEIFNKSIKINHGST